MPWKFRAFNYAADFLTACIGNNTSSTILQRSFSTTTIMGSHDLLSDILQFIL
jgi:hypothetical protein